MGLRVRLQRHTEDTLRPKSEKFLKCIVTYLYCAKYDEINIFYSDVRKHVSYTGSNEKISDIL